MLDIFKEQKSFLTRTKEQTAIYYLLGSDAQGYFIDVCDTKFKPLKEFDYRVYNGLDREILQVIESLQTEDAFTISWEGESERIYLHKHPRLLELLRRRDNLYLTKEKKVSFEKNLQKVLLHVMPKDEKLQITPRVQGEQAFDFLSDCYVLKGERVIPIQSVGENYTKLSFFNVIIEKVRLEEMLSILVTHFVNIEIDYDGFEVLEQKEPHLVKPAVIFEKITPENELVLRISATLSGLSPAFFNDFNISKLALVNSIEKKIMLYECDFSEVFALYNFVYTKLNTLKRKLKDGGFSEEDGLFFIDEELSKEFILTHLQQIIQKAELFGSEKLKSYKYNTKQPTLNIAFKEKIDFLDASDIEVSIGEERFNLFDMIALYKKHSYIPLNNGEKSIVDKNYIAKLERIFKKEGKKVKVSFFDLPEIEELISQKEQKVFKDSKAFYEGFNALKKSKTRMPKLEGITLREYQKEGVKWLRYLYENNFGGCLADDMGLGKTLQSIALLSFIYPKTKKPSLVVMPRSLLNNWKNELERFNPHLSFYIYYDTTRDIDAIQKHQIILTTYALVRNDIEKLKEIEFDTIILDESQNIKNIDSKIAKAVMLLQAKHRFALSGTPIENSLFELYSLFRFLNPGLFSSVNDFKRDFALPIQSEANEEVAKILKAKITPFLLRRLKKDVLKDLPKKQEQVVYVEMDEEHKKFYNKKRDYYREMLKQQIATNGIQNSKLFILQAFNDLRQIASAPELKSEESSVASSKINALFEMLEDIVANNHKVLIFANFLGTLDLISQKANEYGFEHLLMTGSTRDRQALVDKFQNEKSIKLFLMTLKVGGVGLNLTEADYVFIFDPWWNHSAESQAIDRAHRMGQKNTVFAYKMITKGTIEEKILELQMQKKDMTEMVINGDESGLKQLSENDLEYILG